jgi:hypothetical protein
VKTVHAQTNHNAVYTDIMLYRLNTV